MTDETIDLINPALATLDLTNCDREPIHIPGLIQPHGLLLVLHASTLDIVQVSCNTQALIGRQPDVLLGQPLAELLDAQQIKLIQACLTDDFESMNPLHLSIKSLDGWIEFDGIVHRSDAAIVLELEPKKAAGSADFFDFYQQVKGPITRLQKAPTLLAMCETVVKEVQRLTGFDRVMVYRFDSEGAGSVIAEATEQETPYLHLHYPPSDIPKQARQLYTLNWLRLIPDANYQPVGLVPVNYPLTHQPLDLSLAVLRSVSPLHLEYLQNMGVVASMSISLMRDQKLWGLIACHHASSNYLSYQTRTVCEFMGQVMSAELVNKEASDDIDYKMQLKSLQAQFIEALSQAEPLSQADYFLDRIVQLDTQLLHLVNATGAIVCSGKRCISVGETPPKGSIDDFLDWLKPHFEHGVFATRSLAKEYPPATEFTAIASGILALEISQVHHNYILWFRPEVIQTVHWGGNPNKPMETETDGSLRMSPRKSFALWQETVRGSALPWKACEIESVIELRSLIVGVVLRQADELALMNFELQRSNEELDSFAYIASHDLKEPLRGIHNYANFLMEDYAETLDADGIAKLNTLVRLTQRMEDLINSLLYFSRLGRTELMKQSVNLNELVQQAIATLTITRPQSDVEFRVPHPLPHLLCDRAQINELFTNLISNAIKYNDKADKWVEIGFLDGHTHAHESGNDGLTRSYPLSPSPPLPHPTPHTPHPTPIFYVRDNGIGIPQHHLDKIFQIFRRLHGRDDFGGGTGVGLTIVRKIAERHGGKIWVESLPDQGSIFYFTLSAEPTT